MMAYSLSYFLLFRDIKYNWSKVGSHHPGSKQSRNHGPLVWWKEGGRELSRQGVISKERG